MATNKYNPLLESDEHLLKSFVGRDVLCSQILGALRDRVSNPFSQHYLFIGPRGIGKTTLLRKLRLSIDEDPLLHKHYLTLQFPEEMYGISSYRDFFQTICAGLDESLPEQPFQMALRELQADRNDEYSGAKFHEILRLFLINRHLSLVLLVDNLDLILGKENMPVLETKRLRDALMNDGFLVLMTAASTTFGEVSQYTSPFYNLFRIMNLDELNDNQIMELLMRRAEIDGDDDLKARLPGELSKIKALRYLTGGNPRLIVMLHHILTGRQITDVKEHLISLLDEITPYYKHKIEALAPQQRRIIDSMARMDKAVSPTEIAEFARMQVNTVSANLGRLKDAGIVTTATQERRKATYYIISERLFRIWYQMRSSVKAQTKISFFLNFIRIWYTSEEALQSYESATQADPGDAGMWNNKVSTLVSLGRYADVIENYDRAIQINPELVSAWMGRAQVWITLGKFDDALRSMKQGIDSCMNEALKHSFVDSLIEIALLASLHEAKRGNAASSQEFFTVAVNRFREISAPEHIETASRHFFRFFKRLSNIKNYRKSSAFLLMLASLGLAELAQLLFPFEIVNRYWESNRDPEILDRLNPEVREMVEEILLQSEEEFIKL